MSDVEEIAHAIAGAGGGALSMIVTYPLVTLSTLAQTTKKSKLDNEPEVKKPTDAKEWHRRVVQRLQKLSTVEAARRIQREKGVLGFYSGLESALYGITLTNFIYYYFYELTSNVFLRANASTARRGKGLSTFQSIITGAIAGAVTCVGSNPFWVANTRMMTAKKHDSENGEDNATSSTFRTLLNIIETDGPATLFAGVLPALVLVINPIIQYTIFEQVKNVIVANGGKAAFTSIKAFFIGAFGKLIATALTYPYITLKSRMHIKKKKLSEKLDEAPAEIKLSMVQEIRKIVREEGLDGLYGGLTVKLLQSISTAAFLFYFKEELLTGSVKLVEILRLVRAKKRGV
jgi:adenine nucleotide transporter 17